MIVPSDDDAVTPQGWGAVPTWLIRDPSVPVTAKVVYLILSTYVDREGVCFPGQATVAKQAGVSVPTVQRSIATLRDLKIIDVQAVKTRHGRRNVYRLNVHPFGGGVTS